jgi:TPP-dependent 2-oxoacid decarboxylase
VVAFSTRSFKTTIVAVGIEYEVLHVGSPTRSRVEIHSRTFHHTLHNENKHFHKILAQITEPTRKHLSRVFG